MIKFSRIEYRSHLAKLFRTHKSCLSSGDLHATFAAGRATAQSSLPRGWPTAWAQSAASRRLSRRGGRARASCSAPPHSRPWGAASGRESPPALPTPNTHSLYGCRDPNDFFSDILKQETFHIAKPGLRAFNTLSQIQPGSKWLIN